MCVHALACVQIAQKYKAMLIDKAHRWLTNSNNKQEVCANVSADANKQNELVDLNY